MQIISYECGSGRLQVVKQEDDGGWTMKGGETEPAVCSATVNPGTSTTFVPEPTPSASDAPTTSASDAPTPSVSDATGFSFRGLGLPYKPLMSKYAELSSVSSFHPIKIEPIEESPMLVDSDEEEDDEVSVCQCSLI